MAILWGVVGLFVILSIWGLVAILRNSFATEDRVPTGDIPLTLPLPSRSIIDSIGPPPSAGSNGNRGGFYNGVPLIDSPGNQRLRQPDDLMQS